MISKRELKDDELEQVDGGYLYADGTKHMWQVINDETGDVMYETLAYIYAEKKAESLGMSTTVLEWPELDKLRKKAQKNK